MQKVFINGSENDDRNILIIINKGIIEFFYNEYYVRFMNFIEDEKERRGEELSEDEMQCSNLYWIDCECWAKDINNFHKHMARKSWFTDKMSKWMDENVNK